MLGKDKFYSTQNRISKLKRLFSRSKNEPVLNDLLSQDTTAASLSDKMEWLEQILRWLFQISEQKVEVRFRFFFQMLDKNPSWKENFEQTFNAILVGCDFLSVFTYIGLAVDHGLWGDVASRIIEKIIPSGSKNEFKEIISRAFQDEENISQIEQLPLETLSRLKEILFTPKNEQLWKSIESQVDEALLFLSIHAAHYGVSSEVQNRLAARDVVSKSAFFQLSIALQNKNALIYESTLVACESSINSVYTKMEESGVSVDVVNRLETLSALLSQIRLILKIRSDTNPDELLIHIKNFLAASASAGILGQSVLGQIRHHFYLLSRKIVERNGHSGDHYIARNKAENRKLLISAVGGGFIVVLMTILKTLLIQSGPAPLFLASGIWIIYSIGFLSMQFSGCTLATKIPSYTASRLAGLLKTVRKLDAASFRSEVRLVVKSQSLALFGNILGVIPLAILLNFIFQKLSQKHGLMDEHYSSHILRDLNPVHSFAVPLGALTGLQLWLSSIAGGWFENWIVFKRIPNSIRNHRRLRNIFGDTSAKKLSDWVLENASGVATNIFLGFLFGFVPLFGILLGLNWNGNHVTISTASAMFAISDAHYQLGTSEWIFLVTGIALIAIMNFAVSFGLALYIAANAEKMKFWRVLHYLRSSFKIKKSP